MTLVKQRPSTQVIEEKSLFKNGVSFADGNPFQQKFPKNYRNPAKNKTAVFSTGQIWLKSKIFGSLLELFLTGIRQSTSNLVVILDELKNRFIF